MRFLILLALVSSSLTIQACKQRNDSAALRADATELAKCPTESRKISDLEAELKAVQSTKTQESWTEDQCTKIKGYTSTNGSVRNCHCSVGHQKMTPEQIVSGKECKTFIAANAGEWTEEMCNKVDGYTATSGSTRNCLCWEGHRKLTEAQIASGQSCKTAATEAEANWTEEQCNNIGGYTATNGGSRKCHCMAGHRALTGTEIADGKACDVAAASGDKADANPDSKVELLSLTEAPTEQNDGGLGLTNGASLARDEAAVQKELDTARAALKTCFDNNGATAQGPSEALVKLCVDAGGVLDGSMCVCGNSGLSQSQSTMEGDSGASCKRSSARAPFKFEDKCKFVGGRTDGSMCKCGTSNTVSESVFDLKAGNGCRDMLKQFPFEATGGGTAGAQATGDFKKDCEGAGGRMRKVGSQSMCACGNANDWSDTVLKDSGVEACRELVKKNPFDKVTDTIKQAFRERCTGGKGKVVDDSGSSGGQTCECGTGGNLERLSAGLFADQYFNMERAAEFQARCAKASATGGSAASGGAAGSGNGVSTAKKCQCSWDSSGTYCVVWKDGKALTPYYGPMAKTQWKCNGAGAGATDVCTASDLGLKGLLAGASCR